MDTEKDHEFCLRCGRKLKNQQARERGYGNICFKKLKQVEQNRLFNYGEKIAIKKDLL